MGNSMKRHVKLLAAAALLCIGLAGGCEHNQIGDNVDLAPPAGPALPELATIEQRKAIAAATCESQYASERQNYLSAVQTVIADLKARPDMSNAPLERFRAEVNAAYNAMVSRCKTHTNCLEVQGYNEAACYISASDRKDAERRFSDLSERLRQIERDYDKKIARAKKKKSGTRVTVTTNVKQSNDQAQDTHVGDEIEDQDVLVMCADPRNLLKRQCRALCQPGKC